MYHNSPPISSLLRYEPELDTYSGILFVYNSAKQLLTQNGLHHQSVTDWLELTRNYPTFPEIQKSIQQITQYLTTESQHIPQGLILRARSDIIESLFSKYKQFLSLAG